MPKFITDEIEISLNSDREDHSEKNFSEEN